MLTTGSTQGMKFRIRPHLAEVHGLGRRSGLDAFFRRRDDNGFIVLDDRFVRWQGPAVGIDHGRGGQVLQALDVDLRLAVRGQYFDDPGVAYLRWSQAHVIRAGHETQLGVDRAHAGGGIRCHLADDRHQLLTLELPGRAPRGGFLLARREVDVESDSIDGVDDEVAGKWVAGVLVVQMEFVVGGFIRGQAQHQRELLARLDLGAVLPSFTHDRKLRHHEIVGRRSGWNSAARGTAHQQGGQEDQSTECRRKAHKKPLNQARR
jgi:hypothetical protein